MSSEGLAALRIDRSRRRRISPWMWVVLVAIMAVALLSPRLLRGLWVAEVEVAPAVKVSAASGASMEGSPELAAAGYVVADRQSVLAAKFTGRLAKLNVAEADFVKAGDVVAEIDHSEIDAALDQAKAEVAAAEAEVERLAKAAVQADAELAAARAALDTLAAENKQNEILLQQARRLLDRDERLAKTDAVPRSDAEDRRTIFEGVEAKIVWTEKRIREAEHRIAVVEAQAAAAHAAVDSAQARQRSAAAHVDVVESQRDESFIHAPFDGMVTEKAAEVGEIIAPISIGGSMARGSIVTIADWNSLQAEVDVAESQLGRVKPGQRAAITVDAIPDKVFPGKVRRILPRADRSKATVKVRVDFLTRDEKAVLPEMGVRVRFLPDDAPPGMETGQVRDKIAVPREAIQAGQGGSFVWVVADNIAHRRAVQLGAGSESQVEITGGVSAGEKVVVRGAERLTGDSAEVRLAE